MSEEKKELLVNLEEVVNMDEIVDKVAGKIAAKIYNDNADIRNRFSYSDVELIMNKLMVLFVKNNGADYFTNDNGVFKNED